MPLDLPHWFNALTPQEQDECRARLLVRIAALYATKDMTVAAMAEKLGYHPQSLTQTGNKNNSIPPKLVLLIESICGRDLMPRELLNPAIFDTNVTPE